MSERNYRSHGNGGTGKFRVGIIGEDLGNLSRAGDSKCQIVKVSGVFHLFGKEIGDVEFTGNVFDRYFFVVLSVSNGEFTHVNVTEFPGNGTTLGPVYAATIVVSEWSGRMTIGHAEVLEKVPNGEDGLCTFVS
jgi:hypothetical protein